MAAGAVTLGGLITLAAVTWRADPRERQALRRRRAALLKRHDRVLEDLGARLGLDLHHRLLDEPELLEALKESQDARTGEDDHCYGAAVHVLQAQWKAATADRTPAPTT
ncbi:hypothetical protein ACIQ6Y_37650 [Streptomyces sp. NPDC096205]|uniref:hypothetical protein n=1 Tax=Streptomyces sp. NPDC096205 TaxID=3366081 RepID=UPI00380BCAA8